MDSEFPDPDEEFDIVHEEEYELLKEIEEIEGGKVTQVQKTSKLKEKPKEKNETNVTSLVHKELHAPMPEVYKALNTPTSKINNDFSISSTSKDIQQSNFELEGTKKRNYDELFGDTSDILDTNDFVDFQEPREKKPRWDQPEGVIKAVLDARKRYHELSRVNSIISTPNEVKRDTISLRVPQWNFIAVTRSYDAQRIYIRVKHTEECNVKANSHIITNLLSVPYSQLKTEAEEIIAQNSKRDSCRTFGFTATEKLQDDELWVNKYSPRSYIELLSDESVNRHLLHWIKLWDKVVFNRNYIPSKKKKFYSTFRNKKFENHEAIEEVDSKGFPIQRIVLLSGPPGLGKTTLAHLAAVHAGYNVVEVNASDERSPDAFRQILLASTQMKAVMGNDPRPNCLVLDEIDGAPAASIELLLKFIQGKLISKGKKAKKDNTSSTCHRPIICICNEPYSPSLRALRAVALIIPVPEVSPIRLADRLMEVSRKEKLKVNSDALSKLAEISGCDIRSCLGALQYMGSAKLGDNLSYAVKDSRKGLFDTWKQILSIPINRSGILSLPDRANLVLKAVRYGESEKLAQGIFHNYPEICSEKLKHISLSLQWFQFFDEVVSLVNSRQVWSIMPYTNYAFISWHLYLPKSRNVKLSYPSALLEMNQKLAKNIGILASVHRSSGRDSIILSVDIGPFLPDLLSPQLRTVSGHLHSAKERDDITRLVNVLIEFGLTFTQEKTIDGIYDYKLDPNIFEIAIFPECKPRRALPYAVRQIVVQELETERLRRTVNFTLNTKNTNKSTIESEKKENTATNLRKSDNNTKTHKGTLNVPKLTENVKKIDTESEKIKYKDFFGRIITINQDKQKSDKKESNSRNLLTKHGVWYKYKEGFSNAVRRNILMQELL